MKRRILKINKLLVERFGIPERQFPRPSPLSILIGTILSQNTNDTNSFKAYSSLRKKFPHWNNAAEARISEIEKEIKSAGLWKQKAKAIKAVLKFFSEKDPSLNLDYLKDKDSDAVFDELTQFKGVGVKTAACVLLFSLDRNVCPVDTHVFRTLNRIGLVDSANPEKTFYEIKDKIPDGIAHQFHTNLIRLGREICKPQKPSCSICPFKKICKFDNKNFEESKSITSKEFMLLDNIFEV
jgi:endonuclease-3